MSDVDLNLLPALEALLTEGSVTGAARRLGLSASAMSRTLARLRDATGDPLLVRAGRGLVPTPHATALRERVQALSRDAQAVLRPRSGPFDLATLDRAFTIRASQGFLDALGGPLVGRLLAAAPHLRLRFVPKPHKTATPLRDGEVDLEIGVLGAFAPEVRAQALFRDAFVGVARIGHRVFESAPLTPADYAACGHVVAARRDGVSGPVDDALRALGLRRIISVVVPGYPDALRVARHTDLLALVPSSCLGNALSRDDGSVAGLRSFPLPVRTPAITVSLLWHPRMEADAAHRWLRETVHAVGRAAFARASDEASGVAAEAAASA